VVPGWPNCALCHPISIGTQRATLPTILDHLPRELNYKVRVTEVTQPDISFERKNLAYQDNPAFDQRRQVQEGGVCATCVRGRSVVFFTIAVQEQFCARELYEVLAIESAWEWVAGIITLGLGGRHHPCIGAQYESWQPVGVWSVGHGWGITMCRLARLTAMNLRAVAQDEEFSIDACTGHPINIKRVATGSKSDKRR
jgi:hypothetical protein